MLDETPYDLSLWWNVKHKHTYIIQDHFESQLSVSGWNDDLTFIDTCIHWSHVIRLS